MDAIAILDKVSYMYPRSDRLVLADVSLTSRQGEFLGLIGPTGAGKTTLCLTLNASCPSSTRAVLRRIHCWPGLAESP